MQTAERVAQEGKEKRFQVYLASLPKLTREWEGDEVLRESWTDELPTELMKRYAEIESTWDLKNAVHARRFAELMADWITVQKLTLSELENRLRVLHFVEPSRQEQPTTEEANGRAYIGAVNKGLSRRGASELTEEQMRMRELCLRPAKTLTKLRARTLDEDAALRMIVNQEIEVPYSPHFLVQSMDAGELARFTDYMLGIEYPLYARLAPGQRFGENLSRHALLALIYPGAAAAQQHKMEVQEFKDTISRITLDMESRLVKVTFKGKTIAQSWVNWRLPLATKLLSLIDYVSQKQAAKETHELVDLDHYGLTVEVKRGTVTSTDLHWILTTKVDIEVTEMLHPETEGAGLNDRPWLVKVKAEGCPKKLQNLVLIKAAEAEIAIWHHTVHLSRPCGHCLSPLHTARLCKVKSTDVESVRKNRTRLIDAGLPSRQGRTKGPQLPQDYPTSLEQMLSFIGAKTHTEVSQEGRTKLTGGAPAETGKSRDRAAETYDIPKLPTEWAAHKTVREASRVEVRRSQLQTDAPTEAHLQRDDSEMCSQQWAADTMHNSGQQDDNVEMETHVDMEEAERQEVDADGEESDFGADDGMDECRSTAEQSMSVDPLIEQRGRSTAETPMEAIAGRTNRRTVHAHEGRKPSGSPKRKVPKDWESADEEETGTAHNCESTTDDGKKAEAHRSRSPTKKPKKSEATKGGGAQQLKASQTDDGKKTKARSSRSPTKTLKKREAKKGGGAQQFMHQFLTQKNAKEGDASAKADKCTVDSRTADEQSKLLDEYGFVLTKTKPDPDKGTDLDTIVAALGGTIVDVAANGQCGWIALHASFHNVNEGLKEPAKEVADKVNKLKRQVLNSLLANLPEEALLHSSRTFRDEAVVSGCNIMKSSTDAEILAMLANHYDEQRKQSVRTQVPMHFWVRPAHLKAMAIYAREPVYVLDVSEEGPTRIQVYAYADTVLPNGDTYETGTVACLPTSTALELLQELIAGGILPPVLILRWLDSGNHFQAITYDKDRYDSYAANQTEMVTLRNEIRCKYGGNVLDAVPYDVAATTEAAKQALKSIRKEASASRAELSAAAEQSQMELATSDNKQLMPHADTQRDEDAVPLASVKLQRHGKRRAR